MGSTLTWERGRKLSTMSLANGSTASYKYNADGVRTQKTVGGVTTDFFLEGSTIVAQKTGNDVIWYYFDSDGTRDAIEYGGKVYYYMYNPQGDVIGLFDDYLNVVVEYTYDSWGKVETTGTLKDTLGKDNPFRYRGYYYDEESGMYYLNSRYYHPEIGSFINADSVVGINNDMLAYNAFAYCSNNPINFCDSTGQGKIWNWIKEQYNKVVNWFNSKSTYDGPVIPSSNDIVADVLGTLSESFESNFDNVVNGWRPENSPRKTTNGSTIANVSFSFIGVGFDIANTWTARNNNTNLMRLQKTGIQAVSCAAEISIGVFSGKVATAITVLTKGRGIMVGTFMGIAIQQSGCYVIGLIVDSAYDALGIE